MAAYCRGGCIRGEAPGASTGGVAGNKILNGGTWAAITRQLGLLPPRFQSVVVGNESQAAKLSATPIWAFHGEKDQAVPVERSRRMIDAIRKAGGSPKYTEYKEAGHVIWEQVFREPELLTRLFSQRAS